MSIITAVRREKSCPRRPNTIMYGSVDGNGHQRYSGHSLDQYLDVGYFDYYADECGQNNMNMVNSFFNDISLTYADNNNNSLYSPSHNSGPDSDQSFFKTSELMASPPPTPDIITTFSLMPQEPAPPYQHHQHQQQHHHAQIQQPMTPPVYPNLSSPAVIGSSEQLSPSSSFHSIASPLSTTSSASTLSMAAPSPLTVNETKTQLIKESLRLTIQTRRVAMGLDDIQTYNDMSPTGRESIDSDPALTREDEDRRRRRKERNKVAAAKCRNKKKLHSVNLVQEFEALESSNDLLNKEIFTLQKELEQLMAVLEGHQAQCQAKHLVRSSNSSTSSMTSMQSTTDSDMSNNHSNHYFDCQCKSSTTNYQLD